MQILKEEANETLNIIVEEQLKNSEVRVVVLDPHVKYTFMVYEFKLRSGRTLRFHTKQNIKKWMEIEWRGKTFFHIPFCEVIHQDGSRGRHAVVYFNKDEIVHISLVKAKVYDRDTLINEPFSFKNYHRLPEFIGSKEEFEDLKGVFCEIDHPWFSFARLS